MYAYIITRDDLKAHGRTLTQGYSGTIAREWLQRLEAGEGRAFSATYRGRHAYTGRLIHDGDMSADQLAGLLSVDAVQFSEG